MDWGDWGSGWCFGFMCGFLFVYLLNWTFGFEIKKKVISK